MALLSAQRHLTVVLPIVLLSDPAFFPVPLSAFYGTSRPAPHTSQKTRAARESLPGQKPRSSISKFLFVSNSSARSCGSQGVSGMTSVPSLILLVPHHQATQVPAFSCVSVAQWLLSLFFLSFFDCFLKGLLGLSSHFKFGWFPEPLHACHFEIKAVCIFPFRTRTMGKTLCPQRPQLTLFSILHLVRIGGDKMQLGFETETSGLEPGIGKSQEHRRRDGIQTGACLLVSSRLAFLQDMCTTPQWGMKAFIIGFVQANDHLPQQKGLFFFIKQKVDLISMLYSFLNTFYKS